MKNLKHLQVLDIRTPKLSSEGIHEALCNEERPLLTKLCLPRTKLDINTLEQLVVMNPNLEHLCTSKENQANIEVRIFKFLYEFIILGDFQN